MKSLLFLAALALCAAAQADGGGRLRATWTDPQASGAGPLATAEGLQPGIAPPPAAAAAFEAELRAGGHGLAAVATLQEEHLEGDRWRAHGWFNEAYAAGGSGAWQFAAGKRVVAWDVGYAFRANDFVQQSQRRTLLPFTDEGRPLAMAEWFDAANAFTLVAVNPTHERAERGAREPALAARVYRREGAADWHGFARWGGRTHASVGGALAWVADEATEVHASLRWLQAADAKALDEGTQGLVTSNPWQDASVRHATQALLGGTWTASNQASVLAEAWWDGAAPSNAQWDAWNRRNQELLDFVATPAPRGAIAGNLAWQAEALQSSASLRCANLYTRLAWTLERWEPSIDLLLHPADGGRIVTAALGWQADRVRVDLAWRRYGGPARAVLAQLPTKSVAVASLAWSF